MFFQSWHRQPERRGVAGIRSPGLSEAEMGGGGSYSCDTLKCMETWVHKVRQCTQSSNQSGYLETLPLAVLTLSSEEPPTLSPHPGTAHTTLILAVPQTGSTQGRV